MENLWKTVTENVGFIVVIAITAAVLFAVAKLGEMWAGVTSSQQMRTKKIVTIGMMSALAFILQIFDFPVPFAPPFYKLDFFRGASFNLRLCNGTGGRSCIRAAEKRIKDSF